MTLPLRAAPVRAGQPARTPADDDDLPELPSIGGSVLGGGEEAASDLAIDDEIDDSEGEDVGLDAAVGMDDEDDDDELELDDSSRGGVDGWEAEGEVLEDDPELGDDSDEGGWTEGSEAADAPGWDTDLDDLEGEDEPASIRDQGEEGVEERFGSEGEDDAAPDLPAEVRGEDELADDLELEDDAEIDAPAEERIEHPALALRDAEPGTVEWRWLGPEDDAVVAIGGGLAAGRMLYRIDGPHAEPYGATADDDPLAGEVATSIAHVPGTPEDEIGTANEAWIVGLRMGGALRSVDEGPFERLEALRRDAGAIDVLAEPHATGARLWSRTHGGALSRSDDLGQTWSRPLIAGAVHALARAGDGGVVAVIGARSAARGHGGALRVMRTTDGGRGWRSLGGPQVDAIPDAAELAIVADGPHLVLACDEPGVGPFVSRDEGQTWRVLEPIRDAIALASVREDGKAVLYAAVLCEGLDRGLVVRVPLEGAEEPEIVLDLDDVRRRHRVAHLPPRTSARTTPSPLPIASAVPSSVASATSTCTR